LEQNKKIENMIETLPCPFCGKKPEVWPKNPEEEGDCWGCVRCSNDDCPAQPSVYDGEEECDDRGSKEYQNAAIRRWNRRRPR